MSVPDPEFLERIRRQFDHCPYPSIPVEESYQDRPDALYVHNMITAFYRCRREVVEPVGKVILDAGCGSGWKALGLAQSNPGAKIIGVDISAESVEFAKKRLQYHGIENAEFHVLPLENIEQLGLQFDYINCDEVLYLLPDQVSGLNAMRSVLKPEGILRFNLHSLYGRSMMLRSQEAFKRMGLMNDNPEETEINAVRDSFDAMHDHVYLKKFTNWSNTGESTESILANYLLVGDQGFSIPQVFDFLRQANLEFLSMVEWRQWDILTLFKEPNNLPVFWELALPEASIEEQLTLLELFHPINRLIDLWCCCSSPPSAPKSLADWGRSDWLQSTITLHPQLQTQAVQTELERCITQLNPFEIGRFLPKFGTPVVVDSSMAACLLFPLLQKPYTFLALAERWQTLHPINPITTAPTTPEDAQAAIYSTIQGLEAGGYLLVTP